METNTVNEAVDEKESEKKEKKLDSRVLFITTKPYLFPGETEERSETILVIPTGEKSYRKEYRHCNNDSIRRVKNVTLKHGSVKEYFDHLLSEGRYKVC